MCFPTYSTHRKWKWKKGNRQQGAAIILELILCIICKLTEEIEMATGKEEHFKVVKGQEKKNLPSFHFTAATKWNCILQQNLASSIQDISVFDCAVNHGVHRKVLPVLHRQTEPVSLCCLYGRVKQKARCRVCNHVSISSPSQAAGADN